MSSDAIVYPQFFNLILTRLLLVDINETKPPPLDATELRTPKRILSPLAPREHSDFTILYPLESELGSAPVTTLGVVLHGIIGSEADPLGKRAVLPLLLSEGALRAERLLRCLFNV